MYRSITRRASSSETQMVGTSHVGCGSIIAPVAAATGAMMEPQPTCEVPTIWVSDEEARRVMERYMTVAVGGLSSHPEKPSHFVPKYLQEQGYTVIPVNPVAKGPLLGRPVYATLRDVPERTGMVEIS